MAMILTIDDLALLARAPRLQKEDLAFGAPEGLSAYAGQNGLRAEQTRMNYVDAVRRLDPGASEERSRLKSQDRLRTPAPQRALINLKRPHTGPPPGTSGFANHVNPRVTGQARALGHLGRASLGGSLILGGAEILTARDKPHAVGAVAGGTLGGWAGGVAGAETGAAIGALGGPVGALGGAVLGGLIGAAGGGMAGHAAGGAVVDQARRRRPGS